MTPSVEQSVVDAVIATAMERARDGASPNDVALGIVHGLRVIRREIDSRGVHQAAQFDELVRAVLLGEKLAHRVCHGDDELEGRIGAPGARTDRAMEILGDAARTCLLLDDAGQDPPNPMLTAAEFVHQLICIMDCPPGWSEIDDHLRDDRPGIEADEVAIPPIQALQ